MIMQPNVVGPMFQISVLLIRQLLRQFGKILKKRYLFKFRFFLFGCGIPYFFSLGSFYSSLVLFTFASVSALFCLFSSSF